MGQEDICCIVRSNLDSLELTFPRLIQRTPAPWKDRQRILTQKPMAFAREVALGPATAAEENVAK